jgi:hypothetical protein
MITVLIMEVVKINVYEVEVGYGDRRNAVIISAKEKRKASVEEFMFKFETKTKRIAVNALPFTALLRSPFMFLTINAAMALVVSPAQCCDTVTAHSLDPD